MHQQIEGGDNPCYFYHREPSDGSRSSGGGNLSGRRSMSRRQVWQRQARAAGRIGQKAGHEALRPETATHYERKHGRGAKAGTNHCLRSPVSCAVAASSPAFSVYSHEVGLRSDSMSSVPGSAQQSRYVG